MIARESRALSESEPKFILDSKYAPDRTDEYHPSFYSLRSKMRLPPTPKVPWYCGGAPGKKSATSKRPGIHIRVQLQDPSRQDNFETKVRPNTAHSDTFVSRAFPAHWDTDQVLDRSSSRLYRGKYIKCDRYILSKDNPGFLADSRPAWRPVSACLENKIVNIHSRACSDSWQTMRPSNRLSSVQMGFYFVNRI